MMNILNPMAEAEFEKDYEPELVEADPTREEQEINIDAIECDEVDGEETKDISPIEVLQKKR